MKAMIDTTICIGCNVCREVCPPSAIRLQPIDNSVLYEVAAGRCDACAGVPIGALCIEFCPVPGAVSLAVAV